MCLPVPPPTAKPAFKFKVHLDLAAGSCCEGVRERLSIKKIETEDTNNTHRQKNTQTNSGHYRLIYCSVLDYLCMIH